QNADSTRWDAFLAWLVQWGWLLGTAVAAGLALGVLPLAGRWYRGQEVRTARSERDYVESQWLVLTRSLADLGVPDPGPKSPRAMEAHYDERAQLSQESRAALHRVSVRLEQTRYATVTERDDSARGTVGADVETVVESVRSGSPWLRRAKATLLPTSGRAGVLAWVRTRLGWPDSDEPR
ncbi:MAG TPA: hypothetical protein VJ976_01260, partial [Ornithinimicrobium sp.]|uniref:hypothetical protein n=1 Tax=Ornithinimicrobium sp. TaxID=1977084 RepID=UPI002B499D87